MNFTLKRKFWEKYFNKGTVGTVKRCIEIKTKEVFAVKIIKTRNEEIINNMKKEFKRLKKLDHQNIIIVKDLLIDSMMGTLYLVMEYFKG